MKIKRNSLTAIILALSATVSSCGGNVDSKISNPYPCEQFRFGRNQSEVGEIYCVSHGSLVIKTRDYSIFIDPVAQPGKDAHPYECFKSYGNKVVLLTHEHGDHLSKETIDYLSDGAQAESFSIYGNRNSIKQLGRGDVLANGDAVTVRYKKCRQSLKIKAVPAYNTTESRTNFHPKGNGNGYLIDFEGFVIYIAGDTEPIEEMKDLGKVDIAFLPVNQPYTMTPEQCIKAAEAIGPEVLVPYHMGDTDMSSVIRAFENSGTKIVFHEELR